MLSREAGSQLDAAAVAAFLEYYRGRRSVAWSALMTTGPHRLLTWLGGSTQSIGTGIAQVPALGVAAMLAVSPTGLATAAGESASQRSASPERTVASRSAARSMPAPAGGRGVPSIATKGPRAHRRAGRHAVRDGQAPSSARPKRSSRHVSSPTRGAPSSSTPAPSPGSPSTAEPEPVRQVTPKPDKKPPKPDKAPKPQKPPKPAEGAQV